MADKDFVAEIRRQDAADAARAAAIARPPRPRRAANRSALDRWLLTLVEEQAADVAKTRKSEGEHGGRDGALNAAAYRIGKHLHLGIDAGTAENELLAACRTNGFAAEEGESKVRNKIRRSFSEGENDPAPAPDLNAERKPINAEQKPASARAKNKARNGTENAGEFERTVRLTPLSTVKSRVPQWVWTYGGIGRIQLGTLSIFAGKPTAGKSTAVRWFASRLTRGELEGVWYGVPMRVALVMTEEQTDAVIVPGLVAAGADLSMVYEPRFRIGDIESPMMSIADEARLTEELKDKQIGALFVDPIMNTFGARTDINRNNEVRAMLDPYTRIAKEINGIVIGVTHLRKGEVHDVLASINGSSAFGEVPRAVFGFAPISAGDHVMEQIKNSAGQPGLKLGYHLMITPVETDDGQFTELPAFSITGPIETSIADITTDDETTGIAVACEWLKLYLLEQQPAPSSQVKKDARQYGDIGDKMIARAAKRLRVKIRPNPNYNPGKPHTTVWSLPDND